MMQTLKLDPVSWDLTLDANGNIAVADEPYGQAQDAASEIKLFQGEAYYDTARGVPYWSQILGKRPPLSLVRSYLVSAALLVPGIVRARVFFTKFDGRALSGQVQIADKSGKFIGIGF